MADMPFDAAEFADILHQVSTIYISSNIPIDYGTGEKYTASETHMLKYIIDHPGETVTSLSQKWDKTKAAISMMLKKMEQKNLIVHKSAPDSLKKQLYYATELGAALNQAHQKYDSVIFGETIQAVREHFTDEEIACCFRVLPEIAEAIRKKHYHSAPEG